MENEFFMVIVPELNDKALKYAKSEALYNGFNPLTYERIRDKASNTKGYRFTKHGIKTLFNGRQYYKLNQSLDVRGNPMGKVFYMDGTTQIIKDRRLPSEYNRFYKSTAGLVKST